MLQRESAEDDFTVSIDDKIVFFSQYDPEKSRNVLFIQFLSAKGLPLGRPQFIAKSISAVATDSTSILSQNRRYLLYVAHGTSLQVVDAKTGMKLGDKITISRQAGPAAIDPRGHFALLV